MKPLFVIAGTTPIIALRYSYIYIKNRGPSRFMAQNSTADYGLSESHYRLSFQGQLVFKIGSLRLQFIHNLT